MRFQEYERIVCLCVDSRYAVEWLRVRELVRSKGGEATYFVDGRGVILPPETYDQISPEPPDGWCGFPASYCHFAAVQAIVRGAQASGVESLLFLEDDVVFTDRFDEVVEAACRQVRECDIAWDILYYGANHTWADTVEVAPNLLRVVGIQTSHCVGIRQTAFGAILNLLPTAPIDYMISVALHPVLRCYSVWPSVALQRPGYSYINRNHEDYTDYFRSKGRNQPL